MDFCRWWTLVVDYKQGACSNFTTAEKSSQSCIYATPRMKQRVKLKIWAGAAQQLQTDKVGRLWLCWVWCNYNKTQRDDNGYSKWRRVNSTNTHLPCQCTRAAARRSLRQSHEMRRNIPLTVATMASQINIYSFFQRHVYSMKYSGYP